MATTLLDLLDKDVNLLNKTAIETPTGISLSYKETRDLITQVQRKLFPEIKVENCDAKGIPAAVISISLPNSIEFVISFLAVCNLGYAAAPLNPKYSAEEIRFYVSDAKSQAMVIPANSFPKHPGVSVAKNLHMSVWEIGFDEDTRAIDFKCVYRPSQGQNHSNTEQPRSSGLLSDSVALILHTSGTTSKPKCVPLTHSNICQTLENIVRSYRLTGEDKSLVVMPLFHVHGLIGALLSSLHSGGSAVVMPFSVSSFWKTFEERRCTWYSAVPTIHQLLLKNESAIGVLQKKRGLRFIRSCSAALAPSVLVQLESTYGVPVVEAYAMTEASHQMTSNPLPPAMRKPGSVGIPQGVQVATFDERGRQVPEGEVCIKGRNVTSGYLNRPEANAECFTAHGWFRTGDRGYLDKDGYLFLTGRLKEMINRAGEKIAPLEIDAVLLSHPAVSEAVAFGVPDSVYGEEVEAAVVLRHGQNVSASDLIKFTNGKLASFKCPKRIYIASDVPRTATGKIQRRVVSEHFQKKNKSKL